MANIGSSKGVGKLKLKHATLVAFVGTVGSLVLMLLLDLPMLQRHGAVGRTFEGILLRASLVFFFWVLYRKQVRSPER